MNADQVDEPKNVRVPFQLPALLHSNLFHPSQAYTILSSRVGVL